jgi:hypothetical protein
VNEQDGVLLSTNGRVTRFAGGKGVHAHCDTCVHYKNGELHGYGTCHADYTREYWKVGNVIRVKGDRQGCSAYVKQSYAIRGIVTLRDTIRNYVRCNPGMKSIQIASNICRKTSSVRSSLTQLVAMGDLRAERDRGLRYYYVKGCE